MLSRAGCPNPGGEIEIDSVQVRIVPQVERTAIRRPLGCAAVDGNSPGSLAFDRSDPDLPEVVLDDFVHQVFTVR